MCSSLAVLMSVSSYKWVFFLCVTWQVLRAHPWLGGELLILTGWWLSSSPVFMCWSLAQQPCEVSAKASGEKTKHLEAEDHVHLSFHRFRSGLTHRALQPPGHWQTETAEPAAGGKHLADVPTMGIQSRGPYLTSDRWNAEPSLLCNNRMGMMKTAWFTYKIIWDHECQSIPLAENEDVSYQPQRTGAGPEHRL